VGVAYRLRGTSGPTPIGAPGKTGTPAVPVVAATARQGDLPVYLTGLGSVAAFNTATVKSRVDGQITRIAFQEGQLVHEGDLLAEIDRRPFEVQLTQAEGALARDQAQLADAQRNLARFRELYRQKVISSQELDDQVARAGQFAGAVKADQGAIDEANLNLTYARVTAPFTGRVGLKQVDAGNVVHATDPTGIVVLTQVQPITVLFTMPEDNLPAILGRLRTGEQLSVEAYDRAGQTRIATGHLLTADNQIDQSTGTTRLKALFDNQDGALFPNQFVNVRLRLDVRKAAVIVPVTAIQRGPQGTFVYVVKADQTVEVRPVTVGPTTAADAVIETGLAAGDVVVVDGVDRLRPGSAVQVKTPSPSA
jgi:multidrug efflux system membrane fusion protein